MIDRLEVRIGEKAKTFTFWNELEREDKQEKLAARLGRAESATKQFYDSISKLLQSLEDEFRAME